MTVEHEQGDKKKLELMRLQIEALQESMARSLAASLGSRKDQHDRLTAMVNADLFTGKEIDRSNNPYWRTASKLERL